MKTGEGVENERGFAGAVGWRVGRAVGEKWDWRQSEGLIGVRWRVVRGSLTGRMGYFFGEKSLFCAGSRDRSDFFAIRAGGRRILRVSHDS
jgi:hypothetical protein